MTLADFPARAHLLNNRAPIWLDGWPYEAALVVFRPPGEIAWEATLLYPLDKDLYEETGELRQVL